MIGGIIIGDLLSGGMRGGFGGWSPTSFGGSAQLVAGRLRRRLHGRRRAFLTRDSNRSAPMIRRALPLEIA